MKKIMFFAAFVVAMMFASCGTKTVTSDETCGATADSVEVVTVDSVTVDSVAVDSLAVGEVEDVDA